MEIKNKKINNNFSYIFMGVNYKSREIFVSTSSIDLMDRKKEDFVNGQSNIDYLAALKGTNYNDWEYIKLLDFPNESIDIVQKEEQFLLRAKEEGFKVVNDSSFLNLIEASSLDKWRELIDLKKQGSVYGNLKSESDYQNIISRNDNNEYLQQLKHTLMTWPRSFRMGYFGESADDFSSIYQDVLDLDKVHIEEENYLPVSFQSYYPTLYRGSRYNDYEVQLYEYIYGLKYLMQDEFVKNQSMNNKYMNYFMRNGGVGGYAANFENLLNKNYKGPIVLTAVPSSKKNKKNMIERIIEFLTIKNSRFIDGRGLFVKISDEQTAHESNGKRNINDHLNSWKVDVDFPSQWDNYPIIVMDDVETTGTSFEAADIQLVHKYRLNKNNIINFAYGKTMSNIFLEKPFNKQINNIKLSIAPEDINSDSGICGVIFDLDHTIFTSKYRFFNRFDPDLKEVIRDYYSDMYDSISDEEISNDLLDLDINTAAHENVGKYYEFWEFVPQYLTNNKYSVNNWVKRVAPINISMFSKIFDLLNNNRILYSFVTHRSRKNASYLLDKYGAQLHLNNDYKIYCAADYLNKDSDLYDNSKNGKDVYKPNPFLINKCFDDFLIEINHLNRKRVLGVGNTENDIMAYINADIVSYLGTWDNRVLKRNVCGADYMSDNLNNFYEYLKANVLDHSNDIRFDGEPFHVEDKNE